MAMPTFKEFFESYRETSRADLEQRLDDPVIKTSHEKLGEIGSDVLAFQLERAGLAQEDIVEGISDELTAALANAMTYAVVHRMPPTMILLEVLLGAWSDGFIAGNLWAQERQLQEQLGG